VVRQWFDNAIPAALSAAPASFRFGFCFVITVQGVGVWTVDLRSPAPGCRPGNEAGADIEVDTTADVMERTLREPAAALEHYYRGVLRIKGDFRAALRIPQVLLQVARADADESRSASEAPGLESIIAPYSVASFMAAHWPDVPLVVHGPPERFRWLAAILKVRSTEELLATWTGQVTVYPKTSADEFDAPIVSVNQARTLWDAGFALVFGGVDDHAPGLAAVLGRLQSDLGLPRFAHGRCGAYATPPGAGAGSHFDDNVNFVIQLTGEKTWTLAANTHVRRPTCRFVIGGPRPAEELVRELDGELPGTMPEPNEAITLRSGSMLFVPRGYWHATRALAPALSLNFTFDQPCWATVAADAVRRRLLAKAEWRELAMDLDSPNREFAGRAWETMERLLRRLPEEVGVIGATEVLAAARARTSPASRRAKPTPPLDWVNVLIG